MAPVGTIDRVDHEHVALVADSGPERTVTLTLIMTVEQALTEHPVRPLSAAATGAAAAFVQHLPLPR